MNGFDGGLHSSPEVLKPCSVAFIVSSPGEDGDVSVRFDPGAGTARME